MNEEERYEYEKFYEEFNAIRDEFLVEHYWENQEFLVEVYPFDYMV
jgi:hypothetical protein